MRRKVEIHRVSSMGVSLRVAFEGMGFIYGWEVSESIHIGTMSMGDTPVFTSQYFKNPQEASAWVEALTQDMLKIKETQEATVQAFKVLESELDLPEG